VKRDSASFADDRFDAWRQRGDIEGRGQGRGQSHISSLEAFRV
jgi:hypothetical protein